MLILGTDKTDTLIAHLPERYLLIEDGKIADRLPRRGIKRLDFENRHHFNLLDDMDYQGARRFIDILDARFPEGADTLTRKASNHTILKALLRHRAATLDKLIWLPEKPTPGQIDAYQKIETLLFSPVLKRALLRPINFPMDGKLVARLDRATLGDFDCFILGNLLMALYQGHIVVPDFGFYGRPHHIQLMRQNRLIAGLNSLSEIKSPELRDALLLMDEKIACHCLPKDAEELAQYTGFLKDTVGYSDFIAAAVR